jgi:hypothetical protein
MSVVRATSIKGLGVPEGGPEINLNKFNHGSPLDLAGTNLIGSSITVDTLHSTTQNTGTCNATNLVATGRGNINFNGSTLEVPTGTTAERPSNPHFGMIRCNTDIPQIEMYTNKNGTPQWEKLG